MSQEAVIVWMMNELINGSPNAMKYRQVRNSLLLEYVNMGYLSGQWRLLEAGNAVSHLGI